MPNADYNAYLTFVKGIIESQALTAVGAIPPSYFAVAYTCTPGYVVSGTLLSTYKTPFTGSFQDLYVMSRSRYLPKCSSVDYAQVVTSVVNSVWGGNTFALPRRLITIVGGSDAGTDPNRWNSLRALLDSKGVESWAYGVNVGANNPGLLANLASTNNYAHYQALQRASFLADIQANAGLLVCPPGNICGTSCDGFCQCVNSCQCPTCTQDLCTTERKCDSRNLCSGNQISCDPGTKCIKESCDPLVGCQYEKVVCDDKVTRFPFFFSI